MQWRAVANLPAESRQIPLVNYTAHWRANLTPLVAAACTLPVPYVLLNPGISCLHCKH
uniref:Uncharacterized protein n=1 Tax=Arundo donax TaxID=35708 RepID=A0A0A9AEK1_ARUDO